MVMSWRERAAETARQRYFEIEGRTDLSDDDKVVQLIQITSAVCAGVACQPLPFADCFALTPIQGLMGCRIASVRGISLSQADGLALAKDIIGTIGLGIVGQQLVLGAYKTVIPFLGALTTIPLVYGTTYAIGKVMDASLRARAAHRSLSKDDLLAIFYGATAEGRALAEESKHELAASETAKSEERQRRRHAPVAGFGGSGCHDR